jgi:hypothetical protein
MRLEGRDMKTFQSKKHGVLISAFVFLALLPSAIALALCSNDTPSQSAQGAAQESLRQTEEYWLQHEDDPRALETILGDDFVHVLSSGLISKAEHIAYVRGLKKPATLPKSTSRTFACASTERRGSQTASWCMKTPMAPCGKRSLRMCLCSAAANGEP